MSDDRLLVVNGDALECLRALETDGVQCVVTSPPYWGLRDYGVSGQLGLEKTPEEYVANMVALFREVRRILRIDGTCWINLGDSYASHGAGADGKELAYMASSINRLARTAPPGLKPKDLVGIPWMVAFALRADGWYLRSDIIWHKPNPMPESVTDRPTKSHEYLFLLSKSQRYYYDAKAISERVTWEDKRLQDPDYEPPRKERDQIGAPSRGGGPLNRKNGMRVHGNLPGRDDGGKACNDPDQDYRNKRSVWTVTTRSYPEAHFATYPPDLIKPCILAGSKPGDTILDPFGGSGTTGMVALELGRKAILIEINPEYVKLIERRCNVTPGLALV